MKKNLLYRFVLFIRYVLFNEKGVIVLIPARPLRLWKTSLFLWAQSSYFSTLLSWHIIIIPQHPCRDNTKYVVVCTKKNGERWLSSLLSVDNVMVGYRIIPTCDHGEKEVGKKKTRLCDCPIAAQVNPLVTPSHHAVNSVAKRMHGCGTRLNPPSPRLFHNMYWPLVLAPLLP